MTNTKASRILTSLSDLISEDGRTYREINRAEVHAIKVGSLVEVNEESSNWVGLRMYVQGHYRDYNEKILYALTHDYSIVGKELNGTDHRAVCFGIHEPALNLIQSA